MSHSVFLTLAFVFGACIGSFLNVVIWRLPRQQTLSGRSECPSCHHQLIWLDLIPIVSFLWQQGKCRYCRSKISYRYAVIELTTALLFLLAASHFNFASAGEIILLIKAVFVIAICIAVFVIDFEHYLILDVIVLPAMVVVFVFNLLLTLLRHQQIIALGSPIASGVIASAIAAGAFWLLWKVSGGKWMGLGDVKFAAFMGLVLGLPGIAVGLFLAFLLGTAVSVPLLAFGKKKLSSQLPFGTFLAVSTIIAIFWGNSLWQWYWGILGLH